MADGTAKLAREARPFAAAEDSRRRAARCAPVQGGELGIALGWLGLVLLTALNWMPSLVHRRQIGDESYYAVVATEMLQGARPYVEVVDRKPPLLYYTYEAILSQVGAGNWPGLHAAALGWTLFTMVALGFAGAALSGARAGLIAAGLYGFCLPSFDYHDLSLNGEMLMNLPFAAGLALTFHRRPSRLRPELFAAGALLAGAALLKQSAITEAPALGLYVLLPSYRAARGLRGRHSLAHAALLLAGFAVAIGGCACFLYGEGNLREAVSWTLFNNDVTYRPTEASFWLLGARALGLFALASGPLVLLCALGLREGAVRGHRYFANRRPEHCALTVLLATSLVGAAIPGRFFSHYLIQVLPAITLLAAPVASRLWEGATSYRLPVRRWLGSTFALSCAVLFTIHSVGLARRSGPCPAARWVERHSSPSDRILAWTISPDFYLDAKRRPASRFIGTYPLTGAQFGSLRRFDSLLDTSKRVVPGTWDVLRGELERGPPMFVVEDFSKRHAPAYAPNRFPVLRDLLSRRYRVAYDGPDAIVYRRIDPGPRSAGADQDRPGPS